MDIKVFRKSIALLLAALVVSTAALSFYYISAEAFHECEGDGCPVCAIVELSRDLTRKSTSAISMIAAIAAVFISGAALLQKRTIKRAAENLITMKIRLND